MRLPLGAALGSLRAHSMKALRVMQAAGVSDHWKEKAIGAYSRATFMATLRIALMLGLVLAIALGLTLLFDLVSAGFADFLLGWTGLIFTLVAALGWYLLRRRPGRGRGDAAAAYGPLDRLLHRLALGVPALAELSFDMDQSRVKRDGAEVRQAPHVFVSGLARAGTTILMRRIHASGEFRSLTYRDMPFVLAPNLWGRVSAMSKTEAKAAERAHGDNIAVDVDSPESFDEAFWRVFDGESYIARDHLAPHAPDDETRDRFADYVTAILASGDGATRYLSKNNNNVLRLGALRATFPRAALLVPFRDPAAQARSLMRQHANFFDQQSDDGFTRAYMGWLGHHEFGGDHRPFRFDAAGAARLAAGDPKGDAYWLELWTQVYGWLERSAPEDAIFVCYEDLCADPQVWAALALRLGLDPDAASEGENFAAAPAREVEGLDPAALAAARAIWTRLRARGRADLGLAAPD